MKLEDFADISTVLGGGVYLLVYRGEVVFVGKSTRGMLGAISNYRAKTMPSWFPRVTFDQVLVRYIHPDQLESTYAELLAEYRPKHNRDILPALSQPLERRI